ncbi:MAG: malto-oligosyltrehalose synthase [Thermoanaerobaculia bacterium]
MQPAPSPTIVSTPQVATYRLQVHGGFDLRRAGELTDYLAALGVSHVYTSPLLQAVPGSAHGYDVVDPTRIDAERGGEEGYERFTRALAAQGLGHVLDVVPNHMAIATPENRWWWDVLRHGRASRYARFFDIEWEPDTPGLHGRVLVPVLGRPLAEAVAAGEITVEPRGDGDLGGGAGALDGPGGPPSDEPVVRYYEHVFPLALERLDPEDRKELEAGGTLPAGRLLEVLGRQPYRLSHWRRARGELNYRRFFDISDLAGLRQEDPEVFDATHERILRMVREGPVDTLRVDHPDGLRDPEGYLRRLASATGGARIVVEKILEPGEALRESWPVAGTTGYELAFAAGALLVDPAGREPLLALWQGLTGDARGWEEAARAGKRRALDRILRAELDRLEVLFREYLERELGEGAPGPAGPGGDDPAGQVLREVLAAFPVYRTYVRGPAGEATSGRAGDPGREKGCSPGRRIALEDREAVLEAVGRARQERPDLDPRLFELLADALLLIRPSGADLAARFQQTSGPVMAKGVEDTAFYTWTPCVALNEVGASPERFGLPPAAFHGFCSERAERWPGSLNALSTHDTKRGADVRARLYLLTGIPEDWARAVGRWWERNGVHRSADGPDPAAEYLFYQTLVGAWPLEAERVAAYMEKAGREAKVHTTWTAPNEAYESAVRRFVEGVLADAGFRRDLEEFVAPLVGPGRENALALALLQLTAPGVPDLYRGTELWDLSLVDPDNRRPVDWDLRRRLLAELRDGPAPEDLLARADEGLPKLWLIHQALALRRRRPELFGPGGGYEPLAPRGPRAAHAVAFARTGPEGPGAVTLVPRLVLTRGPATDGHQEEAWAGTALDVPAGRWRNVLTGEPVAPGAAALAELLGRFPVALLERESA